MLMAVVNVPNFDRCGLVGYEIKNHEFTGFAAGGVKAIWHSAGLVRASRMVVVECAIDALSHAQISADHEAGYLSIGGALSSHQRDLLRGALTKATARGATVFIATDADPAGDKLANEIAALAPVGAAIERQRPDDKDWNDQLRASSY